MARQDRSTESVAEFFDRRACCTPGAATEAALGPVSAALLELLDDVGVAGRTVLDAGAGQGGLATALGRRGAASVTGIDLSPASVDVARRTSERAGIAASFHIGDAASAELEPHDLVVLDKVVCCYPDVDALLANTVPAARSLFAVAMPCSRGARGAAARVAIVTENLWRWLRRDPFRAYVHDEGTITAAMRAAGFVRCRARAFWTWQLTVHERRG